MTDDMDEPRMDYPSTVDRFRSVWALFTALELGDQETQDRILEEYDAPSIGLGWHVVAKPPSGGADSPRADRGL